jgi:hypothetical protein
VDKGRITIVGIGFGDSEDRRYEHKKFVPDAFPLGFFDGTGDYQICTKNEFMNALAVIRGSLEKIEYES